MTLEFADKAKSVKLDIRKNPEVVDNSSDDNVHVNIIAKLRLELEEVQLENQMLKKKNLEQCEQMANLRVELEQQRMVSAYRNMLFSSFNYDILSSHYSFH